MAFRFLSTTGHVLGNVAVTSHVYLPRHPELEAYDNNNNTNGEFRYYINTFKSKDIVRFALHSPPLILLFALRDLPGPNLPWTLLHEASSRLGPVLRIEQFGLGGNFAR